MAESVVGDVLFKCYLVSEMNDVATLIRLATILYKKGGE
jgi:hypothetical protein